MFLSLIYTVLLDFGFVILVFVAVFCILKRMDTQSNQNDPNERVIEYQMTEQRSPIVQIQN